jgi:FkbH-like protein
MSADLISIFQKYMTAGSLRDLLASVRIYEEAGARRSGTKLNIRLALTGNYSTQFLAKGFPLAMASRDIEADIYESAYNQWQIELLDNASPLYEFRPTHILLLLTSIDLAFAALRSVEAVTAAIIAAVDSALRACDARIIVTLPEPLSDEISDVSGAYSWRHQVNAALRTALTMPRVTLLDLEPLTRMIGMDDWFDERFYDTAKIPFHPDRTPVVLGRLADVIAGTEILRCKLVIVDLDDTLWGGRVGDDGWEALDLSPADKGRHFLRLQAFLKNLHESGVVLAIASKNDPEPVLEAFTKRSEMMLGLEDFVATEIHWEPKSESIARILTRLNLSTAGVIFLDDNPVERAEVRRRFPDIVIPELPTNPADRVPFLISSGLFDHRVATEESRTRNRMYVENVRREQSLQASNIDDFLRQLEMVMEIIPVADARNRVLELIQKTNQFNLTTRRYNWVELSTAAHNGFAQCYRLKDKYGDNGIISVVVVCREPNNDARIDLWLMSCRVLGRKVEAAILADIAKQTREWSAKRLVGEYIPTQKNNIVRDLYPQLGFREFRREGDRIFYEMSLNQPIMTTEYIRVVDGALAES